MAALVNIYFGCGCFWHIQHELIQAERRILNRADAELTTLAGYAAGSDLNSIGAACYPYSNRALGDHELNHAEVVGLQIPRDSFSDFAEEYWSLFVGINRVDVQDRGPNYRAVIGLPGGMNSELFAEIDAAQAASQNFELRAGVGGDADTLGQALVWVYDTDEFPFHQAEVYHQFHDDFQGPQYPQEYNDLNADFVSDCRALATGCHNDPITNSVAGCPERVVVGSTDPVGASVDMGGSGEMTAQEESGGGSGEITAQGGSGDMSMSSDDTADEAGMSEGNAAGDQRASSGDASATFQLTSPWIVPCAILATLSSRM